MKKQNGITLIALIITIIVMLILVGVTINVALNGGLIEKARTAGEQTQKQADIETLQTLAIGAYSTLTNEVDFTKLTEEALKIGFTGSGGTYSKNSVTYKVDKTSAKVEEDNGEVGEETIAGTYTSYFGQQGYPTSIILNDDLTGKMIMGSNEMPCTYEYDEENGKINMLANGQTMPMDYEVINNTRIIWVDKSHVAFYTLGEIDVIAPLVGKTYYGEYTDEDSQQTHIYEFRFKANGLVEYIENNDSQGEFKYGVFGNTIWWKYGGTMSDLEINNDYTQIRYDNDILNLQ